MDYIKQRRNNSYRQPQNRAAFNRPANLRRTAPPAPHSVPLKENPSSKDRKDVNISINLSVPTALPAAVKNLKGNLNSISLPRPADHWNSKYFKVVVGSTLAVAAVFGLWQFFGPSVVPPNEQSAVQGAETTAPQFQPAVPENKKEIERKYYPDRKAFAFKDQVGGIDIVVSQQQLPETFKADPQGNVEAFAKKSSFTTPIEADGLTAYAGKDVSGSQTVVFQMDGLLIFIYAAKELDPKNIASYIKILEN